MKQTWIHFIGKSYYPKISDFVKEAKTIGVSRAISPQMLRKMRLGDIVMLAQKDGPSTKIFGLFKFSEITGTTPAAIETLRKGGHIQKKPGLTPMFIKRGCGQYQITNHFEIRNPNAFMEAVCKLSNEELDRVMIGGAYHGLKALDINADYVLCNIPFRKGYRLFNIGAFYRQCDMLVQKLSPKRHIKVKGQFYVAREKEKELKTVSPIHASLIEINKYQLN
jgi:hypothetical protein